MDKTLSRLFDYQKFENNARLAKMIAETEARYDGIDALSDEDLTNVSAAGEQTIPTTRR